MQSLQGHHTIIRKQARQELGVRNRRGAPEGEPEIRRCARLRLDGEGGQNNYRGRHCRNRNNRYIQLPVGNSCRRAMVVWIAGILVNALVKRGGCCHSDRQQVEDYHQQGEEGLACRPSYEAK